MKWQKRWLPAYLVVWFSDCLKSVVTERVNEHEVANKMAVAEVNSYRDGRM